MALTREKRLKPATVGKHITAVLADFAAHLNMPPTWTAHDVRRGVVNSALYTTSNPAATIAHLTARGGWSSDVTVRTYYDQITKHTPVEFSSSDDDDSDDDADSSSNARPAKRRR